MSIYICNGCAARFERPGDRPYQYCSRGCYHTSRTGQPRLPRPIIKNSCRQCGISFESRSSAGARIKFCSRRCQNVAVSNRNNVSRLTIPQAAYIAGLVDGEGSIVVSDRRHKRPTSTHPSVFLSVAGTYQPMHDWLRQTTGVGSVTRHARSPYGTKPCFSWRVCSSTAVRIMKQIEPYMVEKRVRTLRAIACFEDGYAALDEV